MAELEILDLDSRSQLLIIPIIDVSANMSGDKMASLNDALSEMPLQLAEINDTMCDTRMLIAPIEYSRGARWFLSNHFPLDVDSFQWVDRQAGGASSDLGAAFKLLAEKLRTEDEGGWIKKRGSAAPILILISGSKPTDDYKKQLKALRSLKWFNAALKFAIAVEGADKNILAEFTGNYEAFIDTNVIRFDLASIIKKVFVSSLESILRPSDANSILIREKEFSITDVRCGEKYFEIVCKIDIEHLRTGCFGADNYIVKNDGQLFIARFEKGKVIIADYPRERLDELQDKLNNGQIQIKEAFFRDHSERLYVVYDESDMIKCAIVEKNVFNKSGIIDLDDLSGLF